jgi:hypothetical protein
MERKLIDPNRGEHHQHRAQGSAQTKLAIHTQNDAILNCNQGHKDLTRTISKETVAKKLNINRSVDTQSSLGADAIDRGNQQTG